MRSSAARVASYAPQFARAHTRFLPTLAGVAVLAFSRTRIFEIYYFRMAS